MPTTPEGLIKARVKNKLKAHGAWFFMPVAGPFGRHGIPDIVCCLPNGRFLAVEVKAPGKRFNMTDQQIHVLNSIVEHGGIAVCVDDASMLDEVLK